MLTAPLPACDLPARKWPKPAPCLLRAALSGSILPDAGLCFFHRADDRAFRPDRHRVHIPVFGGAVPVPATQDHWTFSCVSHRTFPFELGLWAAACALFMRERQS